MKPNSRAPLLLVGRGASAAFGGALSIALALSAPAGAQTASEAERFEETMRRSQALQSRLPQGPRRRGAAPTLRGSGDDEAGALRYDADIFALLSDRPSRAQVGRLDFGAWSRGALTYRPDGASGFVQLGADRRIGDDALIGVLAHNEFSSRPGRPDGLLAGPYGVWSVTDGLALDARALGGALGDDDGGTGAASFLFEAGVSGDWRLRRFLFRPEARIDYFVERRGGVDAESGVGRLRLEPEISYVIPFERGVVRPFVGLEDVYQLQDLGSESRQSPTISSGVETVFGRITIRGELTYQNAAEPDEADALGGAANVRIPLN